MVRQDRKRQGRRRQDRTGQDRTGQDRTGQDRTGQNLRDAVAARRQLFGEALGCDQVGLLARTDKEDVLGHPTTNE
jgi:hypothetical protein